jgi:diphosphomevalonate decarboxylase
MTARSAEVITMIDAIQRNDWHYLGRMAEIDSMRLHGITMSGGDDYKIIGWESENIALFRMCNDLRARGIPVYCSTDTGPTAVFMHRQSDADAVRTAIQALFPDIDIIPGVVAGPAELIDVSTARALIAQ